MTTPIPIKDFQAMLKKVRDLTEARKNERSKQEYEEEQAAIASIEEVVAVRAPEQVDLSNLGINKIDTHDEEKTEQQAEIIAEVISGGAITTATRSKKDVGVARDVSLNERQQTFVDTALKGEDVVLIGAAGTGKTTVTGKFVKRLLDTKKLLPLGVDTKWLNAATPGVLITSFTRKAVNNIRRAVPEELKPHVLTMHKVLEFSPVFYEIQDPKDPTKFKNTMKFEPQRTRFNPLPSSMTLVIYEESSMIGTDLYNLMAAAMPHAPQEVFIGDIRQLPPIFGPAILGFKMSLLPVIELTEVYRQALLSPIIRLAHAVLSGDANRFNPKFVTKKEYHPGLKKEVDKKIVPSLEAFNEDGEHGSVKIQIWQKALKDELACSAAVQQFIAWEKNGYYNPAQDMILCPYNKAFGTIDLNKGIAQYLSKKRGSEVHQIIAGMFTHYFAVGDRVLYDKEDAFITKIARSATYMGKTPLLPSVHLDRWGCYQEDLSDEEVKKGEQEGEQAQLAAIDKFMESFGDDEAKTIVASHAITIKFAYSEEEQVLSTAGEVNALLGGNAITIHKAQGSEEEKVFVVLHNSHVKMVQNELLYTAITRARRHLHVICEIDSFFKGVKSQKVRGITLADKIEFFKGKVEFKELEEEMKMLRAMKEMKRKRLEKEEYERLLLLEQQEAEIEEVWEQQPKLLKEEQRQQALAERQDGLDSPYLDDIFDLCSISLGSPIPSATSSLLEENEQVFQRPGERVTSESITLSHEERKKALLAKLAAMKVRK